jgi:hypothetical protein
MKPTLVLPAIALFSLVTVAFGGWSLLALLTRQDGLTAFQEQFFRAGHAHAGVLLVLSLVFFVFLGRTSFSEPTQWVVRRAAQAMAALKQNPAAAIGASRHAASDNPAGGSLAHRRDPRIVGRDYVPDADIPAPERRPRRADLRRLRSIVGRGYAPDAGIRATQRRPRRADLRRRRDIKHHPRGPHRAASAASAPRDRRWRR